MVEITITGTNSITFPHFEVWDWRIVLYLFLGGLSGGTLVMCSIANLQAKRAEGIKEIAYCVRAPLIAFISLVIGASFILLELGNPFNIFRLYLTFHPLSLMSWGAWGVFFVLVANLFYIFAVIPPDKRQPYLKLNFLIKLAEICSKRMRLLAKINFVLGVFLSLYTGVLLASFMAVPLWNNATLPILFLISALSSGAAFIVIIAKKPEIKYLFTKIDIWLIVAELVLIPLYFYGLYTSTEPYKRALHPFFSFEGKYSIYTLALIAIFLFLPLALRIKLAELREGFKEHFTAFQIFRMNFAALLVIAGTLILRAAIVYAGQLIKLFSY